MAVLDVASIRFTPSVGGLIHLFLIHHFSSGLIKNHLSISMAKKEADLNRQPQVISFNSFLYIRPTLQSWKYIYMYVIQQNCALKNVNRMA